MLESHLALPREEYLEAVLNIVSYLRVKHKYRLALDLTYPEIDHASFNNHKWVDLYGNIEEAIPPNMPEPTSNYVDLIMYVDSDHAPRTGFLIYINMALIQWLSKKQPTMETIFLVRSLWQRST